MNIGEVDPEIHLNETRKSNEKGAQMMAKHRERQHRQWQNWKGQSQGSGPSHQSSAQLLMFVIPPAQPWDIETLARQRWGQTLEQLMANSTSIHPSWQWSLTHEKLCREQGRAPKDQFVPFSCISLIACWICWIEFFKVLFGLSGSVFLPAIQINNNEINVPSHPDQ